MACTWSSRSVKYFAAVSGCAALFFAIIAYGYVQRYHVPTAAAVAIYACFLSLLVLLLAPAFVEIPRIHPAAMAAFTIPYLLYAAGTGDFRWYALGKLALLIVVPVAVFVLCPVRETERFHWQDAIAWVWLNIPVILRWETGIWTKPANLDFMARLFTIGVAAWCWIAIRRTRGIGYRFTMGFDGLRAAGVNFVLFAIIAIPLGSALHLAAWSPRWRGVWSFCVDYITIFLFIAWLEELFFRGILQNLLMQTLRSPVRAQIIASAAFGFSHILLAPAPNWRYVLVAFIAGWFYGTAFRQSGTLLGSALIHALVDTVWRTWFSRGVIS